MKCKGFVVGLCAVLLIGLTGCGSSSDMAYVEKNTVATTMEEGFCEAAYDTAQSASGESNYVSESASASTNKTDRKLIRTVSMDVETKEYDNLLATISSEVERLNGYVESLDSYNGSRYSSYIETRHATLVLRIPQDVLGEFLGCLEGASNVVNRSESVQDVTLSYVDIESRKDVLLIEQERLLAFLEQADSMEDIIVLEERLSEIRYEVESMESQLRTYDNKVTYSTVYLDVEEVKELTPVKEETALERMTGGFMDSVEAITFGIKEFFIEFVIFIPYIVVWAVVIALFVVIIKALYKKGVKNEKKRAEKENMHADNESEGK